MKVFVVGVCDCESNSIVSLCETKETAESMLFKERDRLVKEWQEMIDGGYDYTDEMYKSMIQNLSGNNYKNWDNYPHDVPYISEMELIK